MQDKDLVTLTETSERAKSNTHQIDEIKEEIREIKSEQRAIYDIATSVKLIAQDMGSMKEAINEVKQGQSELSDKVDEQIKEVKSSQKTLDNKIDEVKNRPNKWLGIFGSNAFKSAAGVVGTAIATYFFLKVFGISL